MCSGVVASKALLERLDDADAAQLGVRLDQLRYRSLAGLPGVPEKGRRDAGEMAVAELRDWADSTPC